MIFVDDNLRFVRSQDKCIFLLACVEKQYLKQCGFTSILNDFFHTIEQPPTDGLSLVIDENTRVFKGSLLLICGDTLGEKCLS